MLSIQALQGPLAYANWLLYFRVYNLCLCDSMENIFQMNLWNLKKTKVNIVCNEETPPPPLPPQAWRPTRFSVLVEKHTLQDSIKSNDDFFAGNEGDQFDTDTSDSDSGGSNDEAFI